MNYLTFVKNWGKSDKMLKKCKSIGGIFMRKGTKKFFAMALAVTVALGTLTGCGSSGESKDTTSSGGNNEAVASGTEIAAESGDATLGLAPLPERTTLSIGFFAGSAHSMPWYVADQMGFFDALNIDVEYQSFTGGPAMMEANADWDVCDVGAPGMLNGMKNYDINMIGICDNELNTALFVREDSDLAEKPDDPEAWRNKKVLLNKGTTLQYMFMQYMNSIGITDLDEYGIQIIDTAVGTCLTAFQTGEGDAMCVWNAFAVEAENDGYVRVTDIGQMGLNNISCIGATSDAIENKTDLVATAYQVYYKTWEWCQESDANMQEAKDLFMESCEDEGVAVTEEVVDRLVSEFQCTSLADAVKAMTTETDDRNGKGGKVSEASMDFFITLGNYSDDDRQIIIDKGLVNPTIAEMVEQ